LRDRADVTAADMAIVLGHTNTEQQEVYRQLDEEAVFQTAVAIQKKIKGG
jgi:hypothetical protein